MRKKSGKMGVVCQRRRRGLQSKRSAQKSQTTQGSAARRHSAAVLARSRCKGPFVYWANPACSFQAGASAATRVQQPVRAVPSPDCFPTKRAPIDRFIQTDHNTHTSCYFYLGLTDND